jgi:hypothetical protein
LAYEIGHVAEFVDEGQVQEFVKARTKAVDELRKSRDQIAENEQNLHVNELERFDQLLGIS